MIDRLDSDDLARLRVAIDTGRLPRDLGLRLADFVSDAVATNVGEHRARRDRLIRLAGDAYGGSRRQRALAINAEAKRIQRRHNVINATFETALILRALDFAPMPGYRQLLRILSE